MSHSFVTLWTVAHEAPLSMGFLRQENWSALTFPSPRDLHDPGIEPTSPALQADSLLLSHLGSTYGHERETEGCFTHTHTHTHTYKKRWCEDAGRELKQRSHKPKNAGKCQKMEGKLRMDHLMHRWRKSWCEGARDGEMTKEIVPRSSKETFEEKKIIDE